MTFEIYVMDNEERPQRGCPVDVYIPQSFPLSAEADKLTEYTDDDGCAKFENAGAGAGETSIFVNGDNKGRFDLEDGAQLRVMV